MSSSPVGCVARRPHGILESVPDAFSKPLPFVLVGRFLFPKIRDLVVALVQRRDELIDFGSARELDAKGKGKIGNGYGVTVLSICLT